MADDKILLEKFALDGLRVRYGSKNKTALERIKKRVEDHRRSGLSTHTF